MRALDEQVEELFASEDRDFDVAQRFDGGRTRRRIEDAHLAEEVAFFEDRENRLFAVVADARDGDIAGDHDEQRVAWIALVDEDGVFGVTPRLSKRSHCAEIRIAEFCEQRNLFQEHGVDMTFGNVLHGLCQSFWGERTARATSRSLTLPCIGSRRRVVKTSPQSA